MGGIHDRSEHSPHSDQLSDIPFAQAAVTRASSIRRAVGESNPGGSEIELASGESSALPLPPPPAPASADAESEVPAQVETARSTIPADALMLDLPSALQMVGGQHPAVGFAQWRVQEAYAQLAQARVLWLPSLRAGGSYHRLYGGIQAIDGTTVDVSRSSMQAGLGAGAVAAGATTRPGVFAEFHVADAIFQPHIAGPISSARGHEASAVVNNQLLDVALAYLRLMAAKQDQRIIEDSRLRTAELAKITSDFAAAGQGTQADADRLATELKLVENRWIDAGERIDVAAARLAETLSVDPGRQIEPVDPAVTPIELVPDSLDRPTLITTGLTNRPELKEAQCLVAAAIGEFNRQKYAPFVPSVLVAMSETDFGGGRGGNIDDVYDRLDFDAMLTWEIRNLGFGEHTARDRTAARIEQSRYQQLRVMDRVAREVSEAHAQVEHRLQRIAVTQSAIQAAEGSFDKNLRRIKDAQGLPIEVLQSVQALESAQRAYLASVVEYDEAQFRLQWALGWPVSAPAGA
jgi:outer membrane protein TolC